MPIDALDPGFPAKSLRHERERVVQQHIQAEQRGDWDAALAAFHRPRYEIVATGDTYEGPDAVTTLYGETARAFPELSFDLGAVHHARDAVLCEVLFRGAQRGSWRGLPATGRLVQYRMLNVFVFDDDRLVCERMYFDLLTPLRQLGVARDPTSWSGRLAIALNHPLVLARTLIRAALRADRPKLT